MYMYLILAKWLNILVQISYFLCGFFKMAAETVHEIEYLVFHNFFFF